MKKIKPLVFKTMEGSKITIEKAEPDSAEPQQIAWFEIIENDNDWQGVWLTANQCRRMAKQLLLLAEPVKK